MGRRGSSIQCSDRGNGLSHSSRHYKIVQGLLMTRGSLWCHNRPAYKRTPAEQSRILSINVEIPSKSPRSLQSFEKLPKVLQELAGTSHYGSRDGAGTHTANSGRDSRGGHGTVLSHPEEGDNIDSDETASPCSSLWRGPARAQPLARFRRRRKKTRTRSRTTCQSVRCAS